jgi:predicted lipoprotein with Yx(FWY)xxD motif
MTLYSLDKDSASKSNCIDVCAKERPSLKSKKNGKDSGEWAVVARADGSNMWAYGGHPHITFPKDSKAS